MADTLKSLLERFMQPAKPVVYPGSEEKPKLRDAYGRYVRERKNNKKKG